MYTAQSIAESDYEGWVVWLGDQPIFESAPMLPGLLPSATGAKVLPLRHGGRSTMDWKEIPMEKANRFELYFSRDTYPDQPVFRVDKEPESVNTRFIQMKMGGIVVHTADQPKKEKEGFQLTRELGITRGQERLGIVGYKVGFWVPEREDCQLWEFTRENWKHLGKRKSPISAPPLGFGLSTATMGREPS